MAGHPTVTVRLDDGTGTFPYDISAYVSLAAGISITRGRSDEFSTVSPSSLSLTLENTDGRFTYGSTTYASGIFVDQQIRLTETVGGTTSHRFTGYVQNWPTTWPDGSDTYSLSTVTAIDRLARLARRELRSISEQEILLDGPIGYYPLSEPQTATAAADITGNSAPTLNIAGSTTPLAFEAPGPNTWDGTTACAFTGGETLASSGWYTAATTSLTVIVAFSTTTTGPGNRRLFRVIDTTASPGWFEAYMGSSGQITFGLTSTPSSYADGAWHVLHLVLSGSTVTCYIDGSLVATGSGSITNGLTYDLFVGGIDNGATTNFEFVGSLAHFAVYTSALSPTRISAHAKAILNGFDAERSDERISRLAAYANIATGSLALETGYQRVPTQSVNGAKVLDEITQLTDAEAGVAFIRGDGALVLQNRGHRASQVAADWTITSADINPDAAFSVDMQRVTNYVTAKSTVTGVTQVVQNTASISQHEQYPASLDLLVATDNEALASAQWLITTNAQPQPRLPNVTIDLVTQTSTFQQAALTLELSDRLQITGLPAQSPGGTTADLVVEGWTETLTQTSWDLALNTSNFASAWGWVLNDATYSVLGTTTRLGI